MRPQRQTQSKPLRQAQGKPFAGFPSKTSYTALPTPFFKELLPQIDDLVELKVTLYVLQRLIRKGGQPRLVSYPELAADHLLLKSLPPPEEEALRQGLEKAVKRGTLLHLTVELGKKSLELYCLNSEKDKEGLEKLRKGELPLGELPAGAEVVISESASDGPNIFTLYEECIGLVPPLLVDELGEAEKRYPPQWIEDAFKEAVSNNVRRWSYVARILERWASQGRGEPTAGVKSSGTVGRYSKAAMDPTKYTRGRYGRLVEKGNPNPPEAD